MARFDVFSNPGGKGYLLDVQANVLGEFRTRVMVPLVPEQDAPVPARRLNPVFAINSKPHVLVTQFVAAVPTAELNEKVTSLIEEDVAITNALDMLFFGF